MCPENISNVLNASDWIAISSGVIATCALFVSIWQGVVTRNHARLSSRPVMEIECNAYVRRGILLRNCGHGPAIIKSISVTSNGVDFELCGRSDYQRFADHLLPVDNPTKLNTLIPQVNSAIAAGEEMFLINIAATTDDNALGKHLDTLFNAFRVVIVYESLYKEKFSLVFEQL